jgi:hypothetical protein
MLNTFSNTRFGFETICTPTDMTVDKSKAVRGCLGESQARLAVIVAIGARSLTRLLQLFRRSGKRHMCAETEEYLTVEQLAARLGWSPKTVRNKMAPGAIFKKGIHYSEAPGLPVIFKWSAVLKLYDWTPTEDAPTGPGIRNVETLIPMARGYSMR